jgi:hypothetical protein
MFSGDYQIASLPIGAPTDPGSEARTLKGVEPTQQFLQEGIGGGADGLPQVGAQFLASQSE